MCAGGRVGACVVGCEGVCACFVSMRLCACVCLCVVVRVHVYVRACVGVYCCLLPPLVSACPYFVP